MKIHTNDGWTELIVDRDCGYNKFYAVADILQTEFSLTFTQKLNDLESSYWDFQFKGCELTLHYHVQAWLSIFPVAVKKASDADNKSVAELGDLLSQYFINHNSK